MESDAAALSGVVKALLALLLEMLTPDWGAGEEQYGYQTALAVCFVNGVVKTGAKRQLPCGPSGNGWHFFPEVLHYFMSMVFLPAKPMRFNVG